MSSTLASYLWLIPALPLLASVVITCFGPRWLKQHSHWPGVGALAGSAVLSWVALAAVLNGDHGHHRYYTWFQSGSLDVGLTLHIDALTAVMLVTVTTVGSLIAIYAIGYMGGDPGYPRFFAEVSLFLFAMTMLVLADNFVVLYAGWEGVGLCSYLLIGFWYQKPSAAAAARKAFLVTRIGDAGMILGIITLWVATGYHLRFEDVFASAVKQGPTPWLTIACLLLVSGAVGKSAQFPLHVWLPDAMEGPTPVSALIHAATMVTAGVYLIARCMPIFHAAAPIALLVVALAGAISTFLAALIALTQHDLKRVLAYSTISQLGYMFLALGSAVTPKLVGVAVVAALFHLMTHACFKALLFLSAGSVMHSMGNIIDMRRFSGLKQVMPKTHIAFLCGGLALGGVPIFSGFWSKDECIGASFGASESGLPYANVYVLVFLLGLITAGLTAFYTFRAYFLTFFGQLKVPPEAHHHAHTGPDGHVSYESPNVMVMPMMVLSLGALFLGLILQPFTHWISDFFQNHWFTYHEGLLPHMHEHAIGMQELLLMGGSTLFVLAGLGLAAWMYYFDPKHEIAAKLARNIQALYQASLNKFYIDELYVFFIVRPLRGFAEFCRIFDAYVVDGIVDLVGYVPRLGGALLRPIQNGLIQFYALAMMLGLTVFLGALVWKLTQ
ncbi:MAG: NADH-quinone oxidoreductase subunit L [Gemmataceae bacterium]